MRCISKWNALSGEIVSSDTVPDLTEFYLHVLYLLSEPPEPENAKKDRKLFRERLYKLQRAFATLENKQSIIRGVSIK